MEDLRDLKDLTIHDVQPFGHLECLCKTASRCRANVTHTTVKTRCWPWLELLLQVAQVVNLLRAELQPVLPG